MQRKKLLFVSEVFPFPLDRGQHVRVRSLLAACASAFDVTFVGPGPRRVEDRGAVEDQCVRAVYLGGPPSDWRSAVADTARAAWTAAGLPRRATIRRLEPFVAALREVGLQDFDLVWAERTQVARLCTAARGRTIVDLDDLEHVKIARLLKLQRTSPARARNVYRYALFRHLEVSWSRRFLASVVCSEEDRAYLERHGCHNVHVVPNGPVSPVTWAESHVVPRDPSRPLRVVFLGNVGFEPNADAIEFFASEVLPRLRAQIPDATFDVIGPGATPALEERYASRVRFRGFIEDLGAALAEYDVLAAPLRFGGGTKLKVLDAMAHAIPVVTTAVGAEGLLLTHGEHAWLAETADEFVSGIVRIKQDAKLFDRLTTQAYAHVRDVFSGSAIQKRLAEWLVQLEPRR
jgi:glycosyltransferase involved in cell wall biosynthesis